VEVTVTNTGTRAGAEVVQGYVAPVGARVTRPRKELKAFAKVHLEPGASAPVSLELDERSFAHWDPAGGEWRVERGRYELHIGRSVSHIEHVVDIEVT
jgi:beta-glucosidase